MISRDKVIGTIIFLPAEQRTFSTTKSTSWKAVAGQAAIAIENARLNVRDAGDEAHFGGPKLIEKGQRHPATQALPDGKEAYLRLRNESLACAGPCEMLGCISGRRLNRRNRRSNRLVPPLRPIKTTRRQTLDYS